MTDDERRFSAQLVMKRADGASILDAPGAITAETVGRYAVEPERAAAAGEAVRALGFEVEAEDLTTLSIVGPRARFVEVFGLEAGAVEAGVPAHATRIPERLSDLVADVTVPPAPEIFP